MTKEPYEKPELRGPFVWQHRDTYAQACRNEFYKGVLIGWFSMGLFIALMVAL